MSDHAESPDTRAESSNADPSEEFAGVEGDTAPTPVDSPRPAHPHVRLKGIGSLERLRERIEAAAAEMMRLREQNEALATRIKELESRPPVDPKGTFLSLDHDPDDLKQKIGGFIEAIDRYLERESEQS